MNETERKKRSMKPRHKYIMLRHSGHVVLLDQIHVIMSLWMCINYCFYSFIECSQLKTSNSNTCKKNETCCRSRVEEKSRTFPSHTPKIQMPSIRSMFYYQLILCIAFFPRDYRYLVRKTPIKAWALNTQTHKIVYSRCVILAERISDLVRRKYNPLSAQSDILPTTVCT